MEKDFTNTLIRCYNAFYKDDKNPWFYLWTKHHIVYDICGLQKSKMMAEFFKRNIIGKHITEAKHIIEEQFYETIVVSNFWSRDLRIQGYVRRLPIAKESVKLILDNHDKIKSDDSLPSLKLHVAATLSNLERFIARGEDVLKNQLMMDFPPVTKTNNSKTIIHN